MRIFIFIVFIFSELTVSSQTTDSMNFLWNYTSVRKSINNKTDILAGEKTKYSFDSHQLNYYHFDIILYRKISSHFTLGLAVRNAYRDIDSDRISEITPQVYGVYRTHLSDFKLNWSNRFDYRFFDDGTNKTRYRHKLTIASPDNNRKFKIQPYVAEEVLVNLNDKILKSFRLFGGLYLLDLNFLKIDLYYCRNMIENDFDWNHQNISGLNLNFSI